MARTTMISPDLAPGTAPLGPTTQTRSVLNSMAEMREQLLVVTRSAEHSLVIYSADLTTLLFGHAPFLEALKYLVLARRYARVRILTGPGPYRLVPRHTLLTMAERLPSLIEIRTVPPDAIGTVEFVIADNRALVYRIHHARWDGMADLNDPAVAKFYLAQFDALWQAAAAQDEAAQIVGL